MMRPPRFWYEDSGAYAHFLRPLGAIYAAATALRLRRKGTNLGIPVICVGNINAGGTGKTPMVIALLERLRALGVNTHAITHGYGGHNNGTFRVDPLAHSADEVGDEALLLAAFAPTWVARNRVDAAQAARQAGAHVLVLDDGFQDPSLEKTLSFLVVDAQKGFGNGFCLPAGPLREPLHRGLARADILVSIGGADAQRVFDSRYGSWPLPHMRAAVTPLETGIDWRGQRLLAFAGIGHPEKFFSTLRALGANLVETVALEDHQPLSAALLQRLERRAMVTGAQLVTTEKDQVRLPKAYRGKVLTLPVRLVPEDWAAIDAALKSCGIVN